MTRTNGSAYRSMCIDIRYGTFLHSCAHLFGLHRFESTIAIRVILSAIAAKMKGADWSRSDQYQFVGHKLTGHKMNSHKVTPKITRKCPKKGKFSSYELSGKSPVVSHWVMPVNDRSNSCFITSWESRP